MAIYLIIPNILCLLKVSSDGPNVNLKFLDIVREERKDNDLKGLLEVGTCGLHTVHGALKHGGKASGWNIDKILSAIFKIIDQSPSRRTDYERLSGESVVYPLQFCSHRWAENKIVAERAIEVWENMVKTVNHWMQLPKSSQPKEDNKSCQRLKSSINDPLVPVKLKFFVRIADELNKFLVLYQTEKPMVPFLANSLEDMIRSFASTFLIADKLKEANTCLKLSKLNFKDANFHKRPTDVVLPIPVKVALSDLKKKGKVSSSKALQFKSDVISFLSVLCAHLVEKSPIKYALARSATSLIPSHIVEVPDSNEKKFHHLLEILYTSQQLSDKVVEQTKQEYSQFVQEVAIPQKDEFLGFDVAIRDHRLDTFFFKFLEGRPSFSNFANVLKIILTMSHGQASVERGFSINKSLLVENLSKESLISQRIIYDHMKVNDLQSHELEIMPALRKSVKSSRQQYGTYLEEQKRKGVQSEKSRKCKVIEEEIVEIKRRKSLLLDTINDLYTESDKYALDAESADSLQSMKSLVAKSNLFRASAKEKEAKIDEYKFKLNQLNKKKDQL